MALAPESEWESDPELKAMRREFVASFEARWLVIEAALPALRAGGAEFAPALARVAGVAHKLAGAAETYGFPTLTRACAAFEEWFDHEDKGHDPALAYSGAEYMAVVLKSCARAGKDAPEQANNPILSALENAR